MIELTKETLLHYFPYRQQNGRRLENDSIYHVFLQIEDLLWDSMNAEGIVALKLFDYQADVTRRKKHFEKMRGELSKDLQTRQTELINKRTEFLKEYFDTQAVKQFEGTIPFRYAKNPEKAEQKYNELKEEYSDVIDAVEKIQEKFSKKMEGISKVKLKNTDSFTQQEITKLSGKLVKAVRPLLKSKQG